MKKKLLFVINPISGGKDKRGFKQLAESCLDKKLFDAEYVFTDRAGHACELSGEAVSGGFEVVVAVGGDGTINEVASVLAGTDLIMGIVPCGSGNGLALSLGLSLDNRKALSTINDLRSKKIDSALLEGQRFFNMAGIGFDARISHAFAGMKSRGLTGYMRTTLREVSSYKPYEYQIEIDGNKISRTAFMISIANSPQYGNNAYISPEADLGDGYLDICIVKPFRLWQFPAVIWTMFAKKAHTSSYLEIIKGRNIRILSYNNKLIHLDGEPRELVNDGFQVSVDAASLTVLY